MRIGLLLSLLLIGVNMALAETNIEIDTSKGKITVALDEAKAPITVKNFLGYVDSGFFNGTIFHRVIKDFMIQGGGFKPDMSEKQTQPAIKIESSNGLKNMRGTIAMARTNDPNSATSQFFINLVDNSFLDYRNDTAQGIGYAVFGKVTSGLDVVDAIAAVQTGKRGYYSDVPVETVEIKSIRRAAAK